MPRVPVRILQGISGADFSWSPGEVVDMAEEEAEAWADGYRAEYVVPPATAPEAAEAEPVEEEAADPASQAAEKAAVRSRGGGRARRTESR